MRADQLYLNDMVAAAEAIDRFLADAPEQTFLLSELQQSAVLQKLIVIGEAAARVSQATRSAHPHIPWQDIVAFRNIAVHAYFSVDWTIVWHTVTADVPMRREQIDQLLAGRNESSP